MTKELLGSLELNRIYQRDCLSDGGMALIPDKSVDMILCDLPYGTTACKWDTVLPFDMLWAQYVRIIKDNGAIVLTASQPFTSTLGASNIKLLRYSLVWNKKKAGNFAQANKQFMKTHEDILVFYKKQPTYNPQKVHLDKPQTRHLGKKSVNRTDREKAGGLGGEIRYSKEYEPNKKNPVSILDFSKDNVRGSVFHPTQKPVALFEYLIRTYTNEGDIVLDNCMGSGTTAVAAINTNRKFIGFETEPTYIEIANKRIDDLR
jgi:site-specific DNA-methyltransferase (adenine-specific)